MIAEHYNNSFPPQHPSQCSQCILETRKGFGGIPLYDRQSDFPIAIADIPLPHHRIQSQSYHCRPLLPLPLPRLWFIAAQILLGVFESILDAASPFKTADDLFRRQFQIIRKVKFVLFVGRSVASDYQHERVMRNFVPQQPSCIHPPLFRFSSFQSLYTAPGFYPRGYLGWGWQSFASFAFGTSSMFSFLPGQCVNGRIASHPADYVGICRTTTGQCGVKAVRTHHKLPFWKPALYFRKQLLRQFYKAGAVFVMQSHVDRKSHRHAAPGSPYPQGQHHNVQSPAMDDMGGG